MVLNVAHYRYKTRETCAPMQRFCSQRLPGPTPPSPEGSEPSSSSSSERQDPAEGSSQTRRAVQGAAEELRAFCREALYECITQEKPGSLQSYLLLYSLMQGLMGKDQGTGGLHSSHYLWSWLCAAGTDECMYAVLVLQMMLMMMMMMFVSMTGMQQWKEEQEGQLQAACLQEPVKC